MKKLFFFAATAAIALSSCSSDDLAQAPVAGPEVNDGAVQFSAYSARQTRAADTDMTQLQKPKANGGGFGVFAYAQGNKTYSNYSASNTQPNFMYNQAVTWTSPDWVYDPIKYYDNNDNAKHSFFAYAPYDASVKAVFSNSTAPQIRYTAADDIDLLWGCEWDQTGLTTPTTAPMDKPKPSVTDKIAFNFKHAMSKVTIKAVPFVDEVHGTSVDPTLHPEHIKLGTLAAHTVVTLRSVKFEGTNMPSKGLLNLGNGTWTIEETDENAYEMATSLSWDGGSTGKVLADADRLAVPGMENRMVIPTDDKEFKIKVVYDVTTTDAENPKNNSTITNTIISKESYKLKAGTAYLFHLDLGLTSVKFDAKIVPWTLNQDIDVDLPNNKLELISASTLYTAVPTEQANFLGESATEPLPNNGKYYYNTSDNTMYTSSATAWTAVNSAMTFMNNSIIYAVADDGSCTPVDAPRWILVSDTYYMLVNGAYVDKGTVDATSYVNTPENEAKFWADLNAGTVSNKVVIVWDSEAGDNRLYYVK